MPTTPCWPFVYVGAIIICIFFSYNQGVTPDTGNYFKMAENFPKLIENIFPLFYPINLSLFSLIGVNILVASKILAIFCFLVILLLSILKKFYTKEIILVLGLKISSIFYFSWSEPLFLMLFIIYLYVFYLYANKKITHNKFLIYSSLLLFLLFSTRYSGLFILASLIVYQLWNYYKTKKIDFILLKSTFISSLLVLLYLVFNFFNFNNLLGDRKKFELHSTESKFSQIKSNIITLSHAVNPIYTELDYSENIIRFSIIISLLFLTLIFYKLVKIKTWIFKNIFFTFLFINAIVYFIFITISNFLTKIDGLNFRLLLPSIFIFYFLIIVNYLENNKNTYTIYLFIFLSLIINTASVISIEY